MPIVSSKEVYLKLSVFLFLDHLLLSMAQGPRLDSALPWALPIIAVGVIMAPSLVCFAILPVDAVQAGVTAIVECHPQTHLACNLTFTQDLSLSAWRLCRTESRLLSCIEIKNPCVTSGPFFHFRLHVPFTMTA